MNLMLYWNVIPGLHKFVEFILKLYAGSKLNFIKSELDIVNGDDDVPTVKILLSFLVKTVDVNVHEVLLFAGMKLGLTLLFNLVIAPVSEVDTDIIDELIGVEFLKTFTSS